MQISAKSSLREMAKTLSGTGKNVVNDPKTAASSKADTAGSTSSSSSAASAATSSSDPKTIAKEIESLQNQVTQLSTSNENGQNNDRITKLENEIAELQKELAKAEAAAADESGQPGVSKAAGAAASFGPAYQVELSTQVQASTNTMQ